MTTTKIPSLTAIVARAVEKLGTATLDDLVKVIPEYDRETLHKAMKNAKAAGYIKVVKPGCGRGPNLGRYPGTYGVGEKVPSDRAVRRANTPRRMDLMAFASVFDLASEPVPIPAGSSGKKYSPLGAWN